MTIHTKRPKVISCQKNTECSELGSLAYNIASKYDFQSKNNNKWVCHQFKLVKGKNFKLCVIENLIRKKHNAKSINRNKNDYVDEIHEVKQNTDINKSDNMNDKSSDKIIRFNADIVGFDFTSVPNLITPLNITNNTLPITLVDDEEEEEEWLEEDDYLDNAFFS
jgi:hypothetical protein